MIFAWYGRVVIKLGDEEKHVYDAARLMYTEVVELERVSGLSYLEWERDLRQFKMTAIGPLLHILRLRAGKSDFGSMQFNVAQLECTPIHDDGSEFTPSEIAADLASRVKKAEEEAAGPTPAADGPAAPEDPPISGTSTPDGSAKSSESAPGNGNGSPTAMSSSAKLTSTAG